MPSGMSSHVRWELSSPSVAAITVSVTLGEGASQQRGGAGLSEERRCPSRAVSLSPGG